MNLLAGDARWLVTAANQFLPVPAAQLDANNNVVMLNTGERVVKAISMPTAAYRGASVDVVCKWTGPAGKIQLQGTPVTNSKSTSTSISFTWVPQGYATVNLYYGAIDPANPVRNMDCREANADPAATFDPTYLANMRRYNTVRFMDWALINNNSTITWATRNRPGNGMVKAKDGVALEYMIQLANTAGVNPWFNVPWNADATYVQGMATLIRDTLDPKLIAHVEVSNEVWNTAFPATKQAQAEGIAEGLDSAAMLAGLKRYAEKTGQVMDVWTQVFTGQMNRIVRIAATQNSTYTLNQILTFKTTASKIDAVATAPYFGSNLKAGALSTQAAMDAYLDTTLPGLLNQSLSIAKGVKTFAAPYKLRYLAYESGQHVLYQQPVASADLANYKTLERDPRMGKLYTTYLTQWQAQIGDLLTLYIDVGPISQYGAWGMQEYPGQPIGETPKAAAVQTFIANNP